MTALPRKLGFFILTLWVPGCASSGPQRYQSFFQAVESARTATDAESAREGFRTACSQSSSAACHRLGVATEAAAPLPILQGATDESATEVIVVLPEAPLPQIFLWDRNRPAPFEAQTEVFDLPAGRGKALHLRYEGLTRGSRYLFQIVGPAGELLDGRELQTLDLAKKKASIAVASCMDNHHPEQKAMWKQLVAREPELIFLIGDNVYADTEKPGEATPPDSLWKRYWETRQDLELFKIPRLIPIYATWDDHDYGMNDGDRSYLHKEVARQVFQIFFGKAEYPGTYDRGPGVASRLNAFGQRFFFLDDRTFRSPPGEENASHFGIDQESWLFTEIYGDTPIWLISGDQFFGGYHTFESYEGRHRDSFDKLLKRLGTQTAPVVFLSGDRHLAEVMKIPPEVLGYETFEITTSSIHSTVYPDPWKAAPNPRQIEGAASVNNYAILETDAADGLRIQVNVFGPEDRRLFSRSLEIHK